LSGGYGLALAALALVVFGAIECPPFEIYSQINFNFTAIVSHILLFFTNDRVSNIFVFFYPSEIDVMKIEATDKVANESALWGMSYISV